MSLATPTPPDGSLGLDEQLRTAMLASRPDAPPAFVEAQYQAETFEAVLAEVSARFADIHAGEVDGAIEDTQRSVCKHLGLDRSALFQVCDDESDALLLTHLHQPADGPPIEKRPVSGLTDKSYWALDDATPPGYVSVDVKTLFPWVYGQLQLGRTVVVSSLDDLPQEAAADREMLRRYQTRSTVMVPLSVGGTWLGCLTFATMGQSRQWSGAHVRHFRAIAHLFANALARQRADRALRRSEERLQRALDELKRLQDQLAQENLYLREELQGQHGSAPIVGSSNSLLKVLRQAERVATTDSTVLVLGETGTGKELLAQYIHRISGRSGKPLVTTSIAAIPATLLESELFGREKGAYTGALTKEVGRFELAAGGTLFLDEVGEMPMETQAKLLRVLQTGEFERLGSTRTLHVDVRLIAATNRNLPELIKSGSFRQDLFYRLNVFPIALPPLRSRPEDIPQLVWAFVKELSGRMGKAVERIPRKGMEALQAHDWPGNIRELRNVVERSMILARGPELRLILPDGQAGSPSGPSRLLVDVERQHILAVLASTRNRVYGAGGAAEVLGVKPTTLYSRMNRLGIERKRQATH